MPGCAWFLFELPALVTFPAIYLASGNLYLVGNVVLGLWLAHYIHRSLIWCWLVPKRNATVSLADVHLFHWLQPDQRRAIGLVHGLRHSLPRAMADGAPLIAGVGLFVAGAALNVWSDYRLLHLRTKAGDSRVIPSGGAFNFACCPNLTGEIIEWIGFAVLTWSLPGLAFALWTVANLVPRAVWRRDWYRENSDDFPKRRAALIPGVL